MNLLELVEGERPEIEPLDAATRDAIRHRVFGESVAQQSPQRVAVEPLPRAREPFKPLALDLEAAPPSSESRPLSVRRRVAALAGLTAAAAAVVILLMFARSNEPNEVPAATTTAPTPSTELAVRPLDPPIRCEQDSCPSLAVSPEGILVAFDPAAKTLTWYDAEPHVVPVTADVDAEQVRLVAVGPSYGPGTRAAWPARAYLLAGSPDTDSWELVEIDLEGNVLGREHPSSTNIERSDGGLVERLCWSGCEPDVRLLMPWINSGVPRGTYPDLSRTTSDVVVQLGEQRWEVAWPHTLSTRSRAAPRWDGGASLLLVAESDDAASELIELLPDGTIQRFVLGDEPVQVLLRDGSAVVWHDGQLVRLFPPQPAEPPLAWSPELTATPIELPGTTCVRSPWTGCGEMTELSVSPDGTLVAYDPAATTLTWYDDEPRVVPITGELWTYDGEIALMAIGPHDVAYFRGSDHGRLVYVAVAPNGAVIKRVDAIAQLEAVAQTAAGIVTSSCEFAENRCAAGPEWPSPNATLVMPWVDLDGNQITDPRPYPTAKDTDAGVEVRLGEREWLLTQEQLSGHGFPMLVPRSDGGAVALLDETFGAPRQPIKLVELLPDGTVERYVVPARTVVLPDGSVIVLDRTLQLTRLTPPA